MLFDCVVVVLLAKSCIFVFGWLEPWSFLPFEFKHRHAAAFHRATGHYSLVPPMENKQVQVEELATYNRS
jgi:hypothetical protein